MWKDSRNKYGREAPASEDNPPRYGGTYRAHRTVQHVHIRYLHADDLKGKLHDEIRVEIQLQRLSVVCARHRVDAGVLVLDGEHQPQCRQRVRIKLDQDVLPDDLYEDSDGNQGDEKYQCVSLG